MQKIVPGDPKLLALEALAARPESLPGNDVICLHFALAKALEDVGQYDRSFEHLLKGNELKRREIDFDEAREHKALQRIATAFDQNLFDRFAGAGDPSQTPIFIVGMPRSGTTLIEQVLASHPLVDGAGELWTLGRVAQSVVNAAGQPLPFPATSSRCGPKSWPARRALSGRAPAAPSGKTRVTDKAPGNYAYAGLIRLILPNAKIIHSMRDPVDTCLSCFSWYFTFGQPYTYDLAELGRQYRRYRELMQHWRTVLPATTLLDVRYEDMVDNLEEQARRLLDFCGLPWDDRCLNFHQTDRPVSTASSVQVRQPLYRSSLQPLAPLRKTPRPAVGRTGKERSAPDCRAPRQLAGNCRGDGCGRPHRVPGRPGRERATCRPAGRSRAGLSPVARTAPDIGEAYNNLGNVLKDQGRLDDAAAPIPPGGGAAAQALSGPHQPGQHRQRARPARRCRGQLSAGPGRRRQRGRDLQQPGRRLHPTAPAGRRGQAAQNRLDARPALSRWHVNLGILLKELGRYDQAMQCFQNALTLNPDEAAAHAGLGSILSGLGRLDEAVAKYDQALALQPDYAEAHYDRAAVKTFRPGDPELVTLEALAAEPGRLPAWKMAPVHFALGKALDDVGQYDPASSSGPRATP